jgi:hypothetical protein
VQLARRHSGSCLAVIRRPRPMTTNIWAGPCTVNATKL